MGSVWDRGYSPAVSLGPNPKHACILPCHASFSAVHPSLRRAAGIVIRRPVMARRPDAVCGRQRRVTQSHSERGVLQGPIPIAWLQAAAKLPGRSLHAGVALWIAASQLRARVVPLSNLDGARLGCGRSQKYRALAWLEAAGLVRVQRRLGRSPMVTIQTLLSTPSAGDEAVERSGTAKSPADGVRQNYPRGQTQRGGSS